MYFQIFLCFLVILFYCVSVSYKENAKKSVFFRCGRENTRLFSEFFPIFYKTSSPARAGGGGFPDWMTDRPTSGGGFPTG